MQSVLKQMDNPIDPADIINIFDEEAQKLRDRLENVENMKETMIKLLSGHKEITQNEPSVVREEYTPRPLVKKAKIPTEYKSTDTYSNKILFFLNKYGEASTPDLTQYILDEEPDLRPDLVALNVGKNTTRLEAQRKVIKEKDGNKNVFRLS